MHVYITVYFYIITYNDKGKFVLLLSKKKKRKEIYNKVDLPLS